MLKKTLLRKGKDFFEIVAVGPPEIAISPNFCSSDIDDVSREGEAKNYLFEEIATLVPP